MMCGALYFTPIGRRDSCTPSEFARFENDEQKGSKGGRIHKNKKYGFKFVLLETRKGYSIIVGTWSGIAYQGENHERIESGPMITIRHPLWTKSDPRQDIPIMILTRAQAEIANDLSVSAAPFGPQEFSRNAKFVFALPPRFDYGDSTGTEEVREILRNHPLHPF
ncbi:MAG: hypothetical protein DMG38_09140 [Acidobacteria bacterium]|nr:MAG: hypothetical protein DMG38_09140 [Acidobacteriota bacterium]